MLVDFLTKMFPPPHFLKISWVGLDITDEAVFLLEVKERGKALSLCRYAEVAVPSGVMDSGQILDRQKFVEVLKQLRKSSSTPYVNASLPEEKSFLFTAEVGNGDDKEIRRNIEFILEENIPISPAETLFEFDIVEIRNNGEKVLVSVTAMHSRIVEEYNSVIAEAGFIPYSMEVEGRPLVRAVVPRGDSGHKLVIDYNDMAAGVFLVSNGIVRYTSTIKLTDKDIPDNFIIDGKPDALAYLFREIEMVESYWYSKEPSKEIDTIITCGRKGGDKDFIDKLRKVSKSTVEIGNVWVNVCDTSHSAPEISKSDSLRYATAIGLAIKGR
jgi:Tfp pilus assembly PilM family ATPase